MADVDEQDEDGLCGLCGGAGRIAHRAGDHALYCTRPGTFWTTVEALAVELEVEGNACSVAQGVRAFGRRALLPVLSRKDASATSASR